ncbi:KTSC domain-containing protein [Pseudoalteromonas denitrificans]|uniref:KTSC domain-containing protein n=1 Tax=Pseudoalteromonas denitrificans DSM 6059 TaxID=1123010 RepID=A0A1I1PAM8_9GAMM|nr:KTSC domain-containing protein [Pseudoalteromonas denitrificans]SFD06849.1 KTSC domain-containing protein [Pseudoalteromonas denitrificans DSM 6059]
MKNYNYFLTIICIISFQVFAAPNLLDRYCSKNIDQVRIFYINGMFTTPENYRFNLDRIDEFQYDYLYDFPKGGEVTGSYNKNEALAQQILEVARQKYEYFGPSTPQYRIIASILGGSITSLRPEETSSILQIMDQVFSQVNFSIVNEVDYHNAYMRLLSKMHSCNRLVLLGHSQGNFYTNALYEEMILNYQYTDGYYLSDYPMLSLASIATPSLNLGGTVGNEYSSLISHLTLDQDIFMHAVRKLFGSKNSNYSAQSLFDSTGHSLVDSYLRHFGVAKAIAQGVASSIKAQSPFPLFDQHPVNSSAFSHIGYSSINRVLDVQFKSGSVFRYFDIPNTVWEGFYYSTSLGSYYNEYIKGQYTSEKLDL